MSTEVVGDTAYELVYKDDPPLTDAQACALAAEYGKLDLHCKKATWNGINCVIAREGKSGSREIRVRPREIRVRPRKRKIAIDVCW